MRNEKRISRLVACAAATTVVSASAITFAAPLPLLSYNFNEGTGTSATNTGTATGKASGNVTIPADAQLLNGSTAVDIHGAGGSGVTGAATDYALNLTQPTGQGSVGAGPYSARVTRPQIQSLDSFTLAGFFKADEVIGANARLFSFSDSTGTVAMQLSATANGQLGFNVNTGGTSSTAGAYSDVGKYVFFAATYDGTKTINNVTFYKGTTGAGGTFTTLDTETMNAGAVAALTGDPYFFYIGNNASAVRQFDGLLDDIQLYGSTTDATGALSAADVQALYTSESAVPEPVSAAVIFGGAGLMALRRKRSL